MPIRSLAFSHDSQKLLTGCLIMDRVNSVKEAFISSIILNIFQYFPWTISIFSIDNNFKDLMTATSKYLIAKAGPSSAPCPVTPPGSSLQLSGSWCSCSYRSVCWPFGWSVSLSLFSKRARSYTSILAELFFTYYLTSYYSKWNYVSVTQSVGW